MRRNLNNKISAAVLASIFSFSGLSHANSNYYEGGDLLSQYRMLKNDCGIPKDGTPDIELTKEQEECIAAGLKEFLHSRTNLEKVKKVAYPSYNLKEFLLLNGESPQAYNEAIEGFRKKLLNIPSVTNGENIGDVDTLVVTDENAEQAAQIIADSSVEQVIAEDEARELTLKEQLMESLDSANERVNELTESSQGVWDDTKEKIKNSTQEVYELVEYVLPLEETWVYSHYYGLHILKQTLETNRALRATLKANGVNNEAAMIGIEVGSEVTLGVASGFVMKGAKSNRTTVLKRLRNGGVAIGDYAVRGARVVNQSVLGAKVMKNNRLIRLEKRGLEKGLASLKGELSALRKPYKIEINKLKAEIAELKAVGKEIKAMPKSDVKSQRLKANGLKITQLVNKLKPLEAEFVRLGQEFGQKMETLKISKADKIAKLRSAVAAHFQVKAERAAIKESREARRSHRAVAKKPNILFRVTKAVGKKMVFTAGVLGVGASLYSLGETAIVYIDGEEALNTILENIDSEMRRLEIQMDTF